MPCAVASTSAKFDFDAASIYLMLRPSVSTACRLA